MGKYRNFYDRSWKLFEETDTKYEMKWEAILFGSQTIKSFGEELFIQINRRRVISR